MLIGPASGAYAQSTDRERALDNRVKFLEQRLQRIEALLASTRSPGPGKRGENNAPGLTSEAGGPHAPVPTPQGHTSPADPDQVAIATPKPDAPETPSSPDGDNETPQELNIFRDNAVTLRKAGVEISDEVDYTRRQSNLQSDRSILSTTTLRYGILNWLELSTTIPYGYSSRTTTTGPGQSITESLSGLGDLSVQANARIVEQTSNWPGVVLTAGLMAPTGASPYNFNGYSFGSSSSVATPNPRNPLASYFSQATWGTHTNLQFYKTVDPVVLFFGFGIDYLFPVTYNGYTVDGYARFNYNIGLSFAVSEKTTLGLSFNGTYQPDLKVNGRDVSESGAEPALLRWTAIQRIAKDLFLEPSISFGLTSDSPNFVLGLGLRARF